MPHGYRALLESGTRYLRGVVSDRRPILEIPPGVFARELVYALRPHYFAFSALAALAGAAAVAVHGTTAWPRVALASSVSGLGWGVGQILNDLMDRETDIVNAPTRAIASGRLPAGPALLAAVVLGVAVAIATAFVHPWAWSFALPAVLLLLAYNAAKRWPGAGNVAHGALMAVASAIGTLSALPPSTRLQPLGEAALVAAPVWVAVAAIAAWYLQANYEKDRPGDRASGYRTAATMMSVRASAALRAGAIVGIGAVCHAFALLPSVLSMVCMSAGVALGLASAVPGLRHDSDAAALRGYRPAVDATLLCLIALAAPVLGWVGSAVALMVALSLVHAAFAREANP